MSPFLELFTEKDAHFVDTLAPVLIPITRDLADLAFAGESDEDANDENGDPYGSPSISCSSAVVKRSEQEPRAEWKKPDGRRACPDPQGGRRTPWTNVGQ